MTSQYRELHKDVVTSPITVLLVDDDVDLLQVIAEFLADFGYTVLKARSALDAALVSAEWQGHIDLLLTDLELGNNLGTELATLLRIARPSLNVLLRIT